MDCRDRPGQTIQARHIYYPKDVRVGRHFEDVRTELDDGRLMIDYERFHHTKRVGDLPPTPSQLPSAEIA